MEDEEEYEIENIYENGYIRCRSRCQCGKVIYANKKTAETVKNSEVKRGTFHNCKVYCCEYDNWHISSRPQFEVVDRWHGKRENRRRGNRENFLRTRHNHR